MTNYERDIYDLIAGSTPKDKYNNLKAILAISEMIVYPRRGTSQEEMTMEETANYLMPHIKNPNA